MFQVVLQKNARIFLRYAFSIGSKLVFAVGLYASNLYLITVFENEM